MSLPLPESLSTYGFVVGRIVEAIADTSNDPDPFPEAIPASGTVTFTPDETLQKIDDVDYPAFVVHKPWTFTLDDEGNIVDDEGRVGIYLLVGPWTVTFSLSGGGRIDSFAIDVTENHTPENPLQLVSAAPPTPPAQVEIVTVPVPSGGNPGDMLGKAPDGSLSWLTPQAVEGNTHTHTMAQIVDLQGTLSNKVDINDSRLSDAREPVPHNHTLDEITDYAEPDLTGYATTTALTGYATTTALTEGLATKAAASGQSAVNVLTPQATIAIPESPSMHTLTTNQNTEFTFPTTTLAGHTMVIRINGTHTRTFPGSVSWVGGTIPTPANPQTYSFQTFDSGTTWLGVAS